MNGDIYREVWERVYKLNKAGRIADCASVGCDTVYLTEMANLGYLEKRHHREPESAPTNKYKWEFFAVKAVGFNSGYVEPYLINALKEGPKTLAQIASEYQQFRYDTIAVSLHRLRREGKVQKQPVYGGKYYLT